MVNINNHWGRFRLSENILISLQTFSQFIMSREQIYPLNNILFQVDNKVTTGRAFNVKHCNFFRFPVISTSYYRY